MAMQAPGVMGAEAETAVLLAAGEVLVAMAGLAALPLQADQEATAATVVLAEEPEATAAKEGQEVEEVMVVVLTPITMQWAMAVPEVPGVVARVTRQALAAVDPEDGVATAAGWAMAAKAGKGVPVAMEMGMQVAQVAMVARAGIRLAEGAAGRAVMAAMAEDPPGKAGTVVMVVVVATVRTVERQVMLAREEVAVMGGGGGMVSLVTMPREVLRYRCLRSVQQALEDPAAWLETSQMQSPLSQALSRS